MSIHAINNTRILFSEEDSDLASRKWWPNSYGYATRQERGKNICAHRIIGERIYGKPLSPKNIVDHINHDPLDNRRSNLRITDNAGNSQNRRPSYFRGT